MATKEVRVILKPGHEVILKSDSPDIAKLVNSIVELRGQFNPSDIRIECDHKGFDTKSFQEVVIEAVNSFIDAIQLDEEAYERAISLLEE